MLQREKQEAERKRVEAAGIKDFQDIVSQGISDKLLEWKGIEATMELVKSQNSKVIVVGNSKNGLPLIYAGEKTACRTRLGGSGYRSAAPGPGSASVVAPRRL